MSVKMKLIGKGLNIRFDYFITAGCTYQVIKTHKAECKVMTVNAPKFSLIRKKSIFRTDLLFILNMKLYDCVSDK